MIKIYIYYIYYIYYNIYINHFHLLSLLFQKLILFGLSLLCYKFYVYINFMYFIEFMMLHKFILYHVISGSFYKSYDN